MGAIIPLALTAMLGLTACFGGPTPPSAAPASPMIPTEFEHQLLAGARLDLQGTCEPVREKVPAAALGAVVCRPPNAVADRVTLYLFNTRENLLESYRAWLSARNVTFGIGAHPCGAGRPSEGPWIPVADDGDQVMERAACQVDPEGRSHHALILPPFVLVELDGRAVDPFEVGRFAWLGNQDQPGGPTIWSSGGPASPEK